MFLLTPWFAMVELFLIIVKLLLKLTLVELFKIINNNLYLLSLWLTLVKLFMITINGLYLLRLWLTLVVEPVQLDSHADLLMPRQRVKSNIRHIRFYGNWLPYQILVVVVTTENL